MGGSNVRAPLLRCCVAEVGRMWRSDGCAGLGEMRLACVLIWPSPCRMLFKRNWTGDVRAVNNRLQLKGVDASFRDSVFVCFLLLPSDHSIQRTSPSLFRKCTSHTLAARVAILLPFFPHHVGPTPSFSAPSCVRCHQSTPSARCIGCRSLPHGTHLSCAQLENRKGVRVSAQPHQPTPHLLHVILHST